MVLRGQRFIVDSAECGSMLPLVEAFFNRYRSGQGEGEISQNGAAARAYGTKNAF